MIPRESAQQLAGAWFEAWNRHDLEAILAHYADSVQLTSPIASRLLELADGTVRGKASLRSYFARGLATYPDLRFDPIHLAIGVSSLVLIDRSVNDLLAAETTLLDSASLIARVFAHYATPAS